MNRSKELNKAVRRLLEELSELAEDMRDRSDALRLKEIIEDYGEEEVLYHSNMLCTENTIEEE